MILSGIFAFCHLSPRGAQPEAAQFMERFQSLPAQPGIRRNAVLRARLSQPARLSHAHAVAIPSEHRLVWNHGPHRLGLPGRSHPVSDFSHPHRTALLGCVVLMTCFFAADKHHFFDHFWPAQFVDFGGTLGSQAAITVAGLLLATILVTPDMTAVKAQGSSSRHCSSWALPLPPCCLTGLYGISKDTGDTGVVPVVVRHHRRALAGIFLLFLRRQTRAPHRPDAGRGGTECSARLPAVGNARIRLQSAAPWGLV